VSPAAQFETDQTEAEESKKLLDRGTVFGCPRRYFPARIRL